jgi:Protein of unknown function (DUF2934)
MPEHRSIGELAYRLWQSRGCPEGTAEKDWLDAERQLLASPSTARPVKSEAVDDSLKATFPASDPQASYGPDQPPANADAKWKAAAVPKKPPRRSNRSTPNNDATR